MKTKFIIGTLTVVLLLFLCVSLFRGSYANEEGDDNINLELYDDDNVEILKDNMEYFIDLVDNSIIVNSSYNFSDKLNENYDFLTKFAISFILDNEKYFDVIYGDDYTYIDEYGRKYTTNKYINVKDIYEITDSILGVGYYYIMDDNLVVNSDIVALVDMDYPDMEMLFDEIEDIIVGNNYYDVYVKYSGSDFRYVYRFEIALGGRLFISNLSIKE